MRTFFYLVMNFSLFASCTSNQHLLTNNEYMIYPAFDWERFQGYQFYWAVNRNDSTFLIITEKFDDLMAPKGYSKIEPGTKYIVTLQKIDTTIMVRASVDAIVDDTNGTVIYENNRFYVNLYSASEIRGDYIRNSK
jgi:hypothetical protein